MPEKRAALPRGALKMRKRLGIEAGGVLIAEIPASELWLFQNPAAISDVREASQGKVSRLDPEELKES